MPPNDYYRFDEAEGNVNEYLEPYGYTFNDVDGIALEFNGREWEVTFNVEEDGFQVNFGEELPDWIWDELYYMADIYDWDWWVSYEEN